MPDDGRDDQWEAALDRVLELTLLLGRDMTESLARMGLTEARAHLLWDGLAETGFVTREPSPADRRAILVTVTELGRTTTQALVDGHRELARQLFADMSTGEFGGFDAGLGHVLARLRAHLAV